MIAAIKESPFSIEGQNLWKKSHLRTTARNIN